MDDSAVASFVGITDAAPHVASYFLNLTGNDVMQAVGLFYDSPDLVSNVSRQGEASTASATAQVGARGGDAADDHGLAHGAPSAGGVEDDEAMARRLQEDDEAMARRLQEEMYGAQGGAGGDGVGEDGVRAPIARRTETLVGPNADWDDQDEVAQQMARIRQRQRGMYNRKIVMSEMATNLSSAARGGGLFGQRRGGPPGTSGSIWNGSDPTAQPSALPQDPVGTQNAAAARTARLAEMYRAPTEIIEDMNWDEAKELGKIEEKWLLINIQDSRVFDCQRLNRDIWKHPTIQSVVKESFVFMQWEKTDYEADQFIRHYFPRKDDMSAYPYIAIVDPRTGEQVKKWSGPPMPEAEDFIMALYDFLDRYSLKIDATNPVAKRKNEKSAHNDIDRMTEEEMLERAIQSSLQPDGNGSAAPIKEEDPDELTKSIGDLKGKGKETEDDDAMQLDEQLNGSTSASTNSVFAGISSTNPHEEPKMEKGVTGRIQFRHSNGRVIRTFRLDDPIRRIFEWLKAEPLEGRGAQAFELKYEGQDLIDKVGQTIKDVGLSGATVMIEYVED